MVVGPCIPSTKAFLKKCLHIRVHIGVMVRPDLTGSRLTAMNLRLRSTSSRLFQKLSNRIKIYARMEFSKATWYTVVSWPQSYISLSYRNLSVTGKNIRWCVPLCTRVSIFGNNMRWKWYMYKLFQLFRCGPTWRVDGTDQRECELPLGRRHKPANSFIDSVIYPLNKVLRSRSRNKCDDIW